MRQQVFNYEKLAPINYQTLNYYEKHSNNNGLDYQTLFV